MTTLKIYEQEGNRVDYLKLSQIIGASFRASDIVIYLQGNLEYHLDLREGDNYYEFAKTVITEVLENETEPRKFAVKKIDTRYGSFKNQIENSLDYRLSDIATRIEEK